MKRLCTAAVLLVLACGSKPPPPPDVIERGLPGRDMVMPTVAPGPYFDLDDAGFAPADGGLCCPVQFALAASDERSARLVFPSATFDMTRAPGAWTTTACVPPTDTVYFFEIGYPTDDDAGTLWVNRVNDAVTVSRTTGFAPEVNLFLGADGGTCAGLDTAIYATVPDAGVVTTPMDAGATADAGSATDAGSTSDAGSTLPVETTIPGACDTLTAPTVLMSATDGSPDIDEQAGAVTALPFAFTYFGTAVTHFAANSNGTLQVFTSSVAVPDNAGVTAAIPDNASPNGLIAPFWVDLSQAPAGTTELRSQVFTGATPHLTVEWTNWTPFIGSQAARLTFQAKLFSGSNAIEFHYCTLAANTDTTNVAQGFGVTVGIESLTGTAGVQHSRNATVLTTTTGVHFE